MLLRDLHAGLAWFVILGNALAGAWALAAHWAEPLRVRALWIVTAVVEISLVVQVALGVAALSEVDGEPDQFHLFYGFVAVATVGIIYSYRDQLTSHRHLLYGGGGLFLMGLALRSLQFGG